MKNKTFLFLLLSFSIPVIAFSQAPSLTAIFEKQKKTIKLKWPINNPQVTTYVLQKSADNKLWTDIYTVSSRDFNVKNMETFEDRQPHPNKNHYRLKSIYLNKTVSFSTSILVIIGTSTNSWIMYPVPVGPVLNLQYTGGESIQGALYIVIQNASGKILQRLRSATTYRTIQIPVTNLGKGIYDVKIFVQQQLVWNQRFVK